MEPIIWIIRFILTLNTLVLLGLWVETEDRPLMYRIALGGLDFAVFITLLVSIFAPDFYSHATAFVFFALFFSAACSMAWAYQNIKSTDRIHKLHSDLKVYGLIALVVLLSVWILGSWVGTKTLTSTPPVQTEPLPASQPTAAEEQLQATYDSAKQSRY